MAFTVLVVTALSKVSGDTRERTGVVTDAAALSVWKSTLSPALDDLNSFPDPPGIPADEPARVRPCAIDESDGSLVQLTAEKHWATDASRNGYPSLDAVVPEVRAGYAEIVESVVARGWTDRTDSHEESGDGVNGPVRTTLTKSIGNERVTLWIDMYTDSVFATLTFPDAPRACRLEE
ncbi:hypothetical protein [Nocardioides panzhihuensis]|uniref:Uncharacterized protein n=1 Tax=Nocardioides panzhihuensis TaxID=860243 RepID=A0A7Z0DRK8_9ACTN|nr:hypothetical protein [Nocardioides panzhihuensis]NYI80094.1 hypothetical protein [Nocardioides panzhihuensis]